MRTIYACTHMTKESQQDDFEMGLLPGTEVYHGTMGVDITAPTIRELVDNIGNYFCLDMKNTVAKANGDDVVYLDFVCNENGSGTGPTAGELEAWKAGKGAMWHGHYKFRVEKRAVGPVAAAECIGAGLECEDIG